MPIIVSGTLEEIRRSLTQALAVTTYRKHAGWLMFQYDETWNYVTKKDHRVCPVCWAFERAWIGEDIPMEFTAKYRLGQNVVHPNTHETQDLTFLHGQCRCNLIWDDYLEVLTVRLFDELREVM